MKNKILTIMFCIFVFGFMIINIVTKNKELSYSERRYLATLPEITVENIFNGTITNSLETYLADHFVLRDTFRSIKTIFNLKVFNKKDTNNLYYENNHIFKIEYPLRDTKIDNFTKKINKIYETYLKDNNVYLSIIPDKNYYSNNDYLKLDYNKLINSVKNNINENIKYINITNSLTLDDYYRTDIHWKQENLSHVVNTLSKEMNFQIMNDFKENVYDNFYGTYYGQLGLKVEPDKLTYLTNDIIDNATIKDLDSETTTVYEVSSLGKMDSYDVFLSGATPLVEITSNNTSSQKELIIFRDSFSSSLAPLMLDGYKKITLIDIRYMSSSLLENYVTYTNQDVLFLYNTTIINNSDMLK